MDVPSKSRCWSDKSSTNSFVDVARARQVQLTDVLTSGGLARSERTVAAIAARGLSAASVSTIRSSAQGTANSASIVRTWSVLGWTARRASWRETIRTSVRRNLLGSSADGKKIGTMRWP